MVLGQYGAKLADMMVLGQYDAVLAGTLWYWVSITWYCLVLGGTANIKKSGDLVRCYHSGTTNKQMNKER